MKQFLHETESASDAERTATLCVETGIRLVRLVRRAVREAPDAALSPSRLKTLAFLDDNPAACLSDVAEHLIVGAPTASKLVDELVERKLVRRAPDASDRRRLTLHVTAVGRRALITAARPAQERLAQILERLATPDLERVRDGLATLLPLLEAAGASGFRVEEDVEDADG